MKVISFTPATDARNIAHYRRENSFWRSYSLIDLDAGEDVAVVRFYGSGATVYCVAWVWGEIEGARGYGKAGGYGYSKASAAMAEALHSAGFLFDGSIGGVGETAMKDALLAIAAHVGIASPMIHHAHA